MKSTILFAAAALALAGTAAQAETVKYSASLDGKQEVPPVTTSGTGTMDATYDTSSRKLDYTVTYSGLSGPATAAHIHGPAEMGKNAGVLVPAKVAEPIKGEATLTEAQASDLTAGKTYFNIHTAAHPNGEIRGQITK